MKFPRISIITPSFNQAKFIEQTILSVLNQHYPDLEYIVVDGGSTDGTLDILKKYDSQLSWTSRPDRGQTDAINMGLGRATGEVVGYLNSDDLYALDALRAVGDYFFRHPEAYCLTGLCRSIDEHGSEIRKPITLYKQAWMRLRSYHVLQVLNFISQPATFWRRSVTEQIGCLDESLHYTMDYEYWLRMGQRYRMHYIFRQLACFRVHSQSKSGTTANRQFEEELRVAQKYGSGLPILLHRLHKSLIVTVYKNVLGLTAT